MARYSPSAERRRTIALVTAAALGLVFAVVKSLEYQSELRFAGDGTFSAFFELYFLITGFHLAHVIFLSLLMLLIARKPEPVAGISGSLKMTDRFSFGITVKYVREELAELRMGGMLLDLGTYYWTGYKTLRIAAAMRNFGNDVRPGGTYLRRESGGETETAYQSFSPPTLFALGAAMDLLTRPHHCLTGSLQMNHPMDDQENLLLGCEYRFRTLFFLRGGYRANMDENQWTFGAGAKFILKGVRLKLDYAYADYTHLNMSQQFTFGFEF